jgi:hypothetical protein
MSVTSGFFNSLNGDRRYNAEQMSSIFDGIINDGIFANIGTAFFVQADAGNTVIVGIGRAWFNSVWLLNDAILPLNADISEILLDRIDAVVIEINHSESVREGSIKIVKGTPSSNPNNPAMVHTSDINQYPLAYIYRAANSSSIIQADITNMIGTSSTPYITGILQVQNIDNIVAQWQSQWLTFYGKETADMTATNAFWKQQWSAWFNAQTSEIQTAYLLWEAQWNDWFAFQTSDMTATNAFWKQQWSAWFNNYTNNNTSEMAEWRENAQELFDDWFSQLQITLSGDVAANLTNQLLLLEERTDILERFSGDLSTEFVVYNKLYDNGYRTYGDLLDSANGTIIDSDVDHVIGRTYSSDLVLDSNGDPIHARVIFVTK